MGSCVDLRTTLDYSLGSNWAEYIVSNTHLEFHFEIKVPSLSKFGSIPVVFHIVVGCSGRDIARVNQSVVKTVNINQSKIDVVKYDDTKNWKGKGDVGKSKTGGRENLKKNQCAYCKKVGH